MNRLPRKQAQTAGEVIKEFLRSCHLTPKINTECIFSAWRETSGAAPYTSRLFYRDGILYVTLTSSVVRSQLQFCKEDILQRINERLLSDSLFDSTYAGVGLVREIRLK